MTKPAKRAATERWSVAAMRDGVREEHDDAVVVEEPLEIRAVVADGESTVPMTVMMRTPGHDVELAAGLLYTEGLVSRRDDIVDIREAVHPDRPLDNCVEVRLKDSVVLDPARTARTLVSTAACGVCGKATIDAVFATGFPPLPPAVPRISRELLESLPERMAAAQPLFARTGGIHAAALFDAAGNLLAIREDVGRHNAVDKVIGVRFLEGTLPARETILVTSGRAGFEITQKALMAGIPVLAAVGAPSSLSLRLASRAGMTLVGFLRRGRCNLYTGRERILD
jgi:FdhD protein